MAESKEQNVWEKQNNIRVSNQMKVIEIIKEGPMSCSDLSKILKLSNTAVEKIVDELYEDKLLIRAESINSERKLGRKPVLFKLNNTFGVVAAIDLSGRDISVCIADLSNRILVKRKIDDVIYISNDTLNQIKECIVDMLKDKAVKGMKLLSICISSPGKIDKHTFDYIYAPRIENYKTTNLSTYFKECFDNVDVYVFNDTNMGLVGEKRFGCIGKNAQNIYFAHVDITAGSSLYLNGKLFEGSHGFAGEVTDYNLIDDISKAAITGRLYTITDIYKDIIDMVKGIPSHPFYGKDVLHLTEVCDLYFSNDEVVSEAVNKSAKYNSIQMLNVTNLLDLDYIVLEGRVLEFGEKYKALIEKYYKKYDANHNTAKILFSSLDNGAILLGTIYQATNMFFLKQFEQLVVKRTSAQSYDIKEYFGSFI